MHNFSATARIETTHDQYGYADGYFDTDTSDTLDMTVQLPDGDTCFYCTEEVNETVDGWVHNDTDSSYCDESCDPANSVNMDDPNELGGWLAEAGYMDGGESVADALAQWRADNDQAKPNRSAPGNWVGFTVNPEDESTQVQISVGDPRGCMTFTVYRAIDPATGERQLRLRVPHQSDGFRHVELTHLHDGTFVIG